MNFVIVSTGLSDTDLRKRAKDRCLASVVGQTLQHRHIFIEAAEQDPPRSAPENFITPIRALDPTDIVLWVDGDDRLAHPRVLETLARVYEDPRVWMTFGSYQHADGRPGITAPYTSEAFRKSEWLASHLKTARAALFQKLTDDDLKAHGHWRELAWDQAIMFPMLEMSGLEHSRHVDEVLYIYDYATSFEHNAKAAGVRLERAASAEIRSLPPKAKLVSL